LVEAADDVSQGATKGNSGIVHAGYDDKPGTNHAKYCWPGNQMFPQLDRELRFGYQKNGSLVLAYNESEIGILKDLMRRGEANGVERLQILNKHELHSMEPHVNPDAIAALYAPDAGNVIPYEFTIALAENAVDNGVELRIRREVTEIQNVGVDPEEPYFAVSMRHWEPKDYLEAIQPISIRKQRLSYIALSLCLVKASLSMYSFIEKPDTQTLVTTITVLFVGLFFIKTALIPEGKIDMQGIPIEKLVEQATPPKGGGGTKVTVGDMLKGGSGWVRSVRGETLDVETVRARYIINCAGGASDEIASLIGDNSFKIKPRLGDYLLLNRNQVRQPVELFMIARSSLVKIQAHFTIDPLLVAPLVGLFDTSYTFPLPRPCVGQGCFGPNYFVGQSNFRTYRS